MCVPSVGQTIQFWRKNRGLSQLDLADRSGVTRPNLSAIENGGRDLTTRTLKRLALILRVNAGSLVDGIGPKSEYSPVSADRHSVDRIARLAAGQRIRASAREKRTALALSFVMKSKTGWKGVKKRRRTARAENETLLRLKADLGKPLLDHLVRRIEKNLGERESLE